MLTNETRQKRQVNVLLAAGAALLLRQMLEAVSCKLIAVFGFCRSKEPKHIEQLPEEKQRNMWRIDILNSQTGSRAVNILSSEELATCTPVETNSNNTDRNLYFRLVNQVKEMGKK